MKTIKEILQDYTSGKTPVEETNAALAAAEAGYHLEPGRNTLTEEEIRETTIGQYPDMANGYGLLDTGTGSLDKVEIRDGKLVNADLGAMAALVIVAGHTYAVQGSVLAEPAGAEAPWWAPYHTFAGAVAWQDELPRYIPEKDMMSRPKYAGQTVIKGGLRYIYDAEGNAQYQPKSMGDYDKDHGRI